MTKLRVWEHFIRRTCQLDYEMRAVTMKLARRERLSRWIRIAVGVFAPASAATSSLSWVDGLGISETVITTLWAFLIWVTAILAVPLASFVMPEVDRLRVLKDEYKELLGRARQVLDAACYENVTSPAWIKRAREVTSSFASLVHHEAIDERDKQTAFEEMLATYEEYFSQETPDE